MSSQHPATGDRHTLCLEPPRLFDGQSGSQPTPGPHHSPPGEIAGMGQSPAHSTRGPGMASDKGYLSVGEDPPGRDPEHGDSNVRLESAHGYMIAAPGRRL